MQQEPCACGGIIRAHRDHIPEAVAIHTTTAQHRAWRLGQTTKTCPGYGSPCVVTIPKDRDLCHFCRGTRRLLAERATAAA